LPPKGTICAIVHACAGEKYSSCLFLRFIICSQAFRLDSSWLASNCLAHLGLP
jgi:hypothetical protein